MRIRHVLRVSACLLLASVTAAPGAALAAPRPGPEAAPILPHPILFVTQAPIPQDFATINATFGNHLAGLQVAGRGGDLWIRYPDGTLKNLTRAAGFGVDGFQDDGAIAVRDPSVHWDATRAVFSMVVGAAEVQYKVEEYRWQLYEITGLGPTGTPVITKVANQPADYNNVMPAYAPDDRIVFVSDWPRAGEPHLYPQRDEYERTPVNSGLWRLDPASGELMLLDHAPSGAFEPFVDSFGRVIYTRWDHLERDQLADGDAGPVSACYSGATYGTCTYADEGPGACDPAVYREAFPEPRACRDDLLAGTNLVGHRFNHFFPWMINPDGSELETVNHIGRHELHGYFERSVNDDPNVETFGARPRTNPSSIESFHHIAESPIEPGTLWGIDCPEFGTHAAGQIVRFPASPTLSADDVVVTYVTHRATSSTSDTPPPEHSGLYRDPLPLADGTVVASHTSETRQDRNVGTTARPQSLYAFRLRTLAAGPQGYAVPGDWLTAGIRQTITWWDPDVLVTWDGEMWELNPVEVRPRARPGLRGAPPVPAPEAAAFARAGVTPAEVQAYLRDHDLALIVSRDVTSRDDADLQQPYNLRVPGGVQSQGSPGKLYDVSHMQLFQGDLRRGQTGRPGRRVLAQPMHDAAAAAANPPNPRGPAGSTALAADGSMAAFVPARRALSWQLTDDLGTGIVRERYWLTFQPGEVRVCASCHGVNAVDQVGRGAPQSSPAALQTLLEWWRDNVRVIPPAGRCLSRTAAATLAIDRSTLFNDVPDADGLTLDAAAPGARVPYVCAFATATLDPERVLDPGAAPLLFYQMSAGFTLAVVKDVAAASVRFSYR